MNRRNFLQSTGAICAGLAVTKSIPAFADALHLGGNWRTFEVTTRVEVLKPSGVTHIWLPSALIRNTPFQRTHANKYRAEGGSAKLSMDKPNALGIVSAIYPANAKPVLTLTSQVSLKNYAVDLSAPGKAQLPAILVGASAAVLPEQLAIWSYPVANSDPDQASFNMVTAMMCRIHQSGRLDSLSPQAWGQVAQGIRIYKELLRKHIPNALPFYPLGPSDVTASQNPVAFGMRSQDRTVLAIWRLDGEAKITLRLPMPYPKLVYPVDLDVKITTSESSLAVEFPRKRMGCLVSG